jgi:hypothetical protein
MDSRSPAFAEDRLRGNDRAEGRELTMVAAGEIQALLLGAGGFLGTTMAGVGAYRLLATATGGVRRVPESLQRGADSLERVARAVETQNMVCDQIRELKALLMTTREEILKMGAEREQIGRELRLMTRKIEHFSCDAQDELSAVTSGE